MRARDGPRDGTDSAGEELVAERHRVTHHFTVDVEEYFQVSALEHVVRRAEWRRHESRVAASVARLLDLMARHGARGTFFVLGWVAEEHPHVVRWIAQAGHEVASHGWEHARVTELEPEAFRESVRRTKRALEDITGASVIGYRAPSFSIVRGREWALDILAEEGYRYDSSLFPIRRPGYGYASALPTPHWLARSAGGLLEMPPATIRRFGARLPAAGGAYFRLFPYALVRAAFRDAARRGIPGTFYLHPWELDPEQPRFAVSPLTRIRHYGGLSRTASRLARLLSEFSFTAIADSLRLALRPSPASANAERLPVTVGCGGGAAEGARSTDAAAVRHPAGSSARALDRIGTAGGTEIA
jgi:polysaccharide deacetylase family protein (PEP-CTERM system associated)